MLASSVSGDYELDLTILYISLATQALDGQSKYCLESNKSRLEAGSMWSEPTLVDCYVNHLKPASCLGVQESRAYRLPSLSGVFRGLSSFGLRRVGLRFQINVRFYQVLSHWCRIVDTVWDCHSLHWQYHKVMGFKERLAAIAYVVPLDLGSRDVSSQKPVSRYTSLNTSKRINFKMA